ncbi:MAG: class I SAM-dependent methyltransferase [Candidatus Omnitrophota bacterium]
MNRVTVIQDILDRKKTGSYLEIGFGYGDCFLNIKAPRKVVVDPRLSFLKKRTLKYYFKNLPGNILNEYHRTTSDTYFIKRQKALSGQPMDVIFVDGLHTYEQSRKDVLNSLKFLKEDGVIILHDCNPRSEVEALPVKSYEEVARSQTDDWEGYWSGDVWKTIAYLRSTRKDLDIFVLNFDQGVGVISKGKPIDILNYSPEEIDNLTYRDLEANREKILNLKDARYFTRFNA